MAYLGSRENRIRPASNITLFGAMCALAAVTAGCARPEPFVLNPSEFERRSIGKPARIPGVIQVCYAANVTSADAVVRLAEDECAKFGKTPQMIGQDISDCPAVTPITANYLCCPSAVDPNFRYRCSSGGAKVERLNNEQVREALAAERLKPVR